jgi:hypothetical protein
MTAYDDNLEHINKVQRNLMDVCTNLTKRAMAHDSSKLVEPERSGYEALVTRLGDCAYGSDEYRAALAEAKPTIDHHYAANDHHPEHWPDGVAGMSLLSLIEMVADWKAASERTKQGSIAQSLEVNRARFGIDPQLARILENTVRELGW